MAGMYTLLSAYLMLSVFTSLVCEQLLTMWNMVSLHCIAMPKDLYFTAVVFTFFLSSFFFFFWRLISLSSLNRSQTNLDTYRLWLIFGIYPMGGGKHFLGPTLNSTEHISAMEHDSNNRKETCQSTGTPLHAPKFGKLWSRNGWERLASFAHPLHIRIGRHCQPYHMDVI